MKVVRRVLSIITVAVLLLSLCSCGNANNSEIKDNADNSENGFVFKGDDSVELGTPSVTLDPQTVYSKVTYTPEMFYGNYRLRGGDKAEEKFAAETQYSVWENDKENRNCTVLPFRIAAGKNNISHSVIYIKEYNWMRLYFMRKYDNDQCYLYDVLCSYEIDGNKLKFKLLDSFNLDQETNQITYTFSDVVFEYAFSFEGRNLTLTTADGTSVTLTAGFDTSYKDNFYINNYLSPNSDRIDGIDHINFNYKSEDKKASYLTITTENDEWSYNSIATLQENGLFTLTVALKESTKTYQFVYFYGAYDGIVLTDGTNTYYYNDTYSDRNKTKLKNYLTEDQTQKLDKLSDNQLETIVKKKENLIEDLANAFNEAGIDVTVDEENGELAIGSSVLFGGDSAVVTSKGKEFLNKFMEIYTSIISSEKYDGFISKTIIEGHIAPVSGGTYESGLPLSTKRANNVKDYCLSSDTGVDTSKIADSFEAVGLSNSKPIYKGNGKVDMAACRRVSFRFIVNIDI